MISTHNQKSVVINYETLIHLKKKKKQQQWKLYVLKPMMSEHRKANSCRTEASWGWGCISDHICLSLYGRKRSALVAGQTMVLAIYIGSILSTTQSHRVTENSQTLNRNAHCRLDVAKRNREFPHK